MMPLALLLTPDDQAVSAITSVLEEMGVTWERPRDGASAATRLHSGNVDLVLVDCENLPAAKLILDVCRRTKTGRTLVGIAIADGRTGLPTAFRLGAEFILTRPVAKDQARNTVRAALNRSKKAGSASGTATENADRDAQANRDPVDQNSATQIPVLACEDSVLISEVPTTASSYSPAESKTMTVGASGESSWREIHYIASSATATMSAAADVAGTDVGKVVAAQTAATETVVRSPHLEAKDGFSDDLVLAEIQRTERESEGGLASSAALPAADDPVHEKKGSALVIALLVLAQVCSGFYAAWVTQPKLRTFLQPQIHRVRTFVGIGNVGQASTRSPSHDVRGAQRNSAPQLKPADAASEAQTPNDAKAIVSGSDKSAILEIASPPGSSGTKQHSGSSTPSLTASRGGTEASVPAEASGAHKSAAPNANTQSNEPRQNDAAHLLNATGQPSETTGVVLSSKGAEKRLVSSVPPQYHGSKRGEEAVVLRVFVDAEGKVASLQVAEGQSDFAIAAAAAVKQWRYRPYMRDGKAVPFETVVQINPAQP